MPFVPFTKKSSGQPSDAPDASASVPTSFSKKSAKRRRKTGKVAPAQKALMNPGGRSMSGGGR